MAEEYPHEESFQPDDEARRRAGIYLGILSGCYAGIEVFVAATEGIDSERSIMMLGGAVAVGGYVLNRWRIYRQQG